MIKPGDTAAHVTWFGGGPFRLNRQVTHNPDSLTRGRVLDRDASRANFVNCADRRAVLLGDRSAGPAEKDVGKRVPLAFIAALVDVQHDLPSGARLDAVEVPQRHHGP